MLLAAACSILLLGSCGTSKNLQGSGSAHQPVIRKRMPPRVPTLVRVRRSRSWLSYRRFRIIRFIPRILWATCRFNLQAGDKDITVPGKLSMRKDEIIRIQLFIPILGTEVGRLEFTPDYVLIIDRLHKEYIKADYTQVDFLKKQGISLLFSAGSLLEPVAPAGQPRTVTGIRPEEV